MGVKNHSQVCSLLNQNTQRVVQQQNPLYRASASWLSDHSQVLNGTVQTVEVRQPIQNSKDASSQRFITMATAAKLGN